MGDRSAIEWTDATWNPVRARHPATGRVGHHCEHVSEGCRNCYAERMNRWRGTGWPYKPGAIGAPDGEIEVFLDEGALAAPLRWRRPRMIFVCSMTDLFAGFVTDAMLDRVFAVMAACSRFPLPSHTFQVLTKRPERARAYLSDPALPKRIARAWCYVGRNTNAGWTSLAWKADGEDSLPAVWPLPHVWLGTSVEDQATADARIPHLLATPAATRFVSAEPLLGPIDFDGWLGESSCGSCDDGVEGAQNRCARSDIPRDQQCPDKRAVFRYDEDGSGESLIVWPVRVTLDAVFVGGESGPGARPMHPDWPRAIRDPCAATGVPFFFKQWGEWVGLRDPGDGEWPTDAGGFIRLTYSGDRHDGGWPMQRVGKKHAGRLLDGVEHKGLPA